MTAGRETLGRRRVIVLGIGGIAILVATVLLGPRASVDGTVPDVRLPEDLDAWLARSEAEVPGLRRGAAKTIVWHDPDTHVRTALALVYLHGFSADRQEVDPLPRMLADTLGANLYYTRLTGHGRDGAAMAEATVHDWLGDLAESMAIGERLGERVVLMGTSTGGTLALWAAARPRWRKALAAVVLISPNLGLRDPAARVLTWPWGGLLARMAVGRERCFRPENERQAEHWTTCYPTSALLPMAALVETVRALPFEDVDVPLYVAYSPLDRVVDPTRTRAVVARLASPHKRAFEVAGEGDPEHHVLAGDILSPWTTAPLVNDILSFMRSLP